MTYLCTHCEFESSMPGETCPECRSFLVPIPDAEPVPSRVFRRVPLTRSAEHIQREQTGLMAWDTVTDGGLVYASVTILAGGPGIGKTTLLLQLTEAFTRTHAVRALFASGEESQAIFGDRTIRLGLTTDRVLFLEESNVLDTFPEAEGCELLVLDSLSKLWHPDIDGAPGGPAQMKACSQALQEFARGTGTPVVCLQHVTKEGQAAGPLWIEHLVDVVLYLRPVDGEPESRVLFSTKNRFGRVPLSVPLRMATQGLALCEA